ncbi:MAG: hypothetical protein ACOYOV_00310 [Bacteroidales bacterium]
MARTRYTGNCCRCNSSDTDRWYRKAVPEGIICRSCYGKHRLTNPNIRATRISDRARHGIENPYKEAIRIARYRNREFTLTELEYLQLIKECYYCNKDLSLTKSGVRLDRINSEIGYIKNNVIGCCGQCNVAKNNYTLEEFLEWILKLDITKIQQLIAKTHE